jgi:diaminopimelate epimerase
MRFAKYQGLGNDFLVVDLRAADAATSAAAQDPDVVRGLCDRQFGVGGDGVLAVLPPVTASAIARMRVLNADGSEAEMCGNGIRCVVVELHDRGGVAASRMTIDTGAGPLACGIDAGGVTVAMGRPRLTCAEIPVEGLASGERWIERALPAAGELREPWPVTCVSMGNPHAIAFVGSRDDAYRLATQLGPAVERHPAFPRRTNAEFAFVRGRREIDLVVWERGCGITLACGTGACATAVAAVLTGRCDDGEIQVHLPGGTLAITPGLDGVTMRGPAARVFDGELDPRALSRRPATQ